MANGILYTDTDLSPVQFTLAHQTLFLACSFNEFWFIIYTK